MLKAIIFIWSSLKPVVVIILVFIIISSSLFIYDGYRTYQDRTLGAKLIKNIKVKSSCTGIVGTGEKLDLKFSLTNGNDQEVTLEKIGIDVNLLGANNKTFAKLVGTKPKSLKSPSDEAQFVDYIFKSEVELNANSKKDVVLTIQAASKNDAKAASHTIVVYKGKVVFSFIPESSIETSCQIQVRYP